MKTYDISAAGIAGVTITTAGLADGEGGDGGADLGTAGADGSLSLDDLGLRWGCEGRGRGHEHAEDGRGDGGELHFFYGGLVAVCRYFLGCLVCDFLLCEDEDGVKRNEANLKGAGVPLYILFSRPFLSLYSLISEPLSVVSAHQTNSCSFVPIMSRWQDTRLLTYWSYYQRKVRHT